MRAQKRSVPRNDGQRDGSGLDSPTTTLPGARPKRLDRIVDGRTRPRQIGGRPSGPLALPAVFQDAACAGEELPSRWWDFTVDGETPRRRKARHEAAAKICRDCPIHKECDRWAADNDDWAEGVYAGVLRVPGARPSVIDADATTRQTSERSKGKKTASQQYGKPAVRQAGKPVSRSVPSASSGAPTAEQAALEI